MKVKANLLKGRKALLLDMNGTFMFGEDRFGPTEDFSLYYSTLGGKLERSHINTMIRAMYEYLSERYVNEKYRHCFPSLQEAIRVIANESYEEEEFRRIIATFAHHECGYIPEAYVDALRILKRSFLLGAVIDIWSPKAAWQHTFRQSGILDVWSAMSFSSDHGMVKPSPKPFELVLDQLKVARTEAVVIGDSPRRDLGGAKNAGLDCILVGGTTSPEAIGSFTTLLELCEQLES